MEDNRWSPLTSYTRINFSHPPAVTSPNSLQDIQTKIHTKVTRLFPIIHWQLLTGRTELWKKCLQKRITLNEKLGAPKAEDICVKESDPPLRMKEKRACTDLCGRTINLVALSALNKSEKCLQSEDHEWRWRAWFAINLNKCSLVVMGLKRSV